MLKYSSFRKSLKACCRLSLQLVTVACLFFSSRRRHTRLTCDWSSDVCSSDLDGGADDAGDARRQLKHPEPGLLRCRGDRSEERRVGKECSARLCWTH